MFKAWHGAGGDVHVLTAPTVVGEGRVRRPGWVALDGDRVAAVGDGAPPADAPAVTLDTGVLAPGFVDIQLNGAYGEDFAAADRAGWERVLTRLPETGCTSVVPTFITAPVAELADGLRRYAAWRAGLDAVPGAARTLGVHLEGPFLAAGRRGAHRLDMLCDPTPARVAALLDAVAGTDDDAAGRRVLAYLTLAPERPHALAAVRALTAAGVPVAVGHSDATDVQVRAAADAGASLVTHLFNAQRPLRHRDPGTVGAALADPRLTLGLIADLHHVLPTAVTVAFAAAGGRIALVTDAVAAMGMPPGSYDLGGVPLTVVPGGPPLREDGTIAGSALRMDTAVANAVACGVGLAAAVDAATRVPADALGRRHLGRLAPGAAADVVWLSDDLRARATWVAGRLAWADGDARAALAATPAGAEAS